MKARFLPILLLLILAYPAFGKHKAPPATPSDRLSQYCDHHLEQILAPLTKRVAAPRTSLAELRTSFITQLATSVDPEKTELNRAVALCDLLSSIMDDRDKAVANLTSSAAVGAPSDLGAIRKDDPGYNELDREAHEEHNRKHQADQTNNFFTTQAEANWVKKTVQYRATVKSALAQLQ
jgi:hypothetical protein